MVSVDGFWQYNDLALELLSDSDMVEHYPVLPSRDITQRGPLSQSDIYAQENITYYSNTIPGTENTDNNRE